MEMLGIIGKLREWIGSTNGIFALPSRMDRKYKRHFRSALPAARHGLDMLLRTGEGDVAGVAGCGASERPGGQAGDGGWHTGWHRRSTHVPERTSSCSVGLVERVHLVASTGRRDRGWICSE